MKKILVTLLYISVMQIQPVSAGTIINLLEQTEAQPSDAASEEHPRAAALLVKDLELKRSNYARNLELQAEGLIAGKDVDEAKIEYEKAQILAAPRDQGVAQILQSIENQRALTSLVLRRYRAACGLGACPLNQI